MIAKYFTHQAYMKSRRFVINGGRFSVFEVGTQLIQRADSKSATLYIGMHYLGNGLWEDSKSLIPLVLASIQEYEGLHRYENNLYRAIRVNVRRMSRMPYPLPGSPYIEYEKYNKGSWFLGRVAANRQTPDDNSFLFDASKWELIHGADQWYCRKPERCRGSF